jgi:hypothetical protein
MPGHRPALTGGFCVFWVLVILVMRPDFRTRNGNRLVINEPLNILILQACFGDSITVYASTWLDKLPS